MPSTKGLEVFVRKTQVTNREWFGLIEARRELLKPHLDSLTLPVLASLECLRTESFKHTLGHDVSVLTGDARFSFATQGIFYSPHSAVERIPNSGFRPPRGGVPVPDGTRWVWGLTRSGLWILATVTFVGENGYKDRGYERATEIEIQESDLPTMVAKTKEEPQQMWKELGEVIKRLAAHRKALYERVFALAQMVEMEETASLLVSKEK